MLRQISLHAETTFSERRDKILYMLRLFSQHAGKNALVYELVFLEYTL